MLKPGETYEEVFGSFSWEIPEFYNMGVDICDKWAPQRYRLALIYENEKGQLEQYTFWDLKRLSNRLANGLKAHGLSQGDRMGIMLPQSPEAGISHIAIYKTGAIAIPLFTLFGTDGLAYRLSNSEAKGIVTDEANLQKVLDVWEKVPSLEIVVVTRGERREGILDFWELIEKGSTEFQPVQTRADDPAFISYTSGTTGPPKGAFHAHRVLLGHMPGIEFPHNFFPKEDDLFWTPADWAWMGGFMDVLLPSWHHGIPVVAHRAKKFDPEEAFYLMAKYGIRNAFMPPTALKMMRQVKDPRSRYDYRMRTIGSGGEALGEELLEWGKEVMGLTINEFYGQTEVNLVVGSCCEIMEIRPGSMGKAIPNVEILVINSQVEECAPGEKGELVHRGALVTRGYWNDPEKTGKVFKRNPLLKGQDHLNETVVYSGDLVKKDEEGFLYFVSRRDEMIKTSGYRVSPAEVEETLIEIPEVSNAIVFGKEMDEK